MKSKTELAIIILNYNNYVQTVSLVKQIQKLQYPIIIVDNASNNNSWDELIRKCKAFHNVYLIKSNRNEGYSKGNNIGIRYAVRCFQDLRYVAIMNPDIEICNENIFETLCEALEKDQSLGGITAMTIFNNEFSINNPCAGRLLSDNELIISDVAFLCNFINKNYSEFNVNNLGIAYVDKLQGCFFIMKKPIFESIGYLDENVFLYYEEDIIGEKVRNLGYKLGVMTDERIKHNHEIKEREMIDLKNRQFYNKCMLKSKKYYMLYVMGTSYWKWLLSYLLDCGTRMIKDICIRIKDCLNALIILGRD